MDCHNYLETPIASKAIESSVGCAHMNETFFSTFEWVEAWSRSFVKDRLLAIPVRGSGPPRTMYGIQKGDRFGLYSISLAPAGRYASPGWVGELECSTLQGILDRLKGFRTRQFVWNVRFDHEPLAAGLISLGLRFRRTTTHVLHLEQDYEHIFAGYTSTNRNKIRKTGRRGVLVREAHTPDDVHAYYQMRTQMDQQKGRPASIYPVQLLLELIKIPGAVRLFVAECEGRIAAGGLFYQDGCSVMYSIGASDRSYSHFHPAYAVFDKAIRWACESGATFFDFGGSAGIASLEQFKSFWGARPELNWQFEWMNPFWARLSRLKGKIVTQKA
jgi:hypothetical protein